MFDIINTAGLLSLASNLETGANHWSGPELFATNVMCYPCIDKLCLDSVCLKCIIILITLMINAFGPNKWMANVFSI